jgi:hypothetical protein
MKERPILFNADMVRAILNGRKTQTRRLMKPQPVMSNRCGIPFFPDGSPVDYRLAPLGCDGDRLWVRETTCIAPKRFATPDDTCLTDDDGDKRYVSYKADGHSEWAMRDYNLKWTPSIHVPRWASRIDLEITAVRVERLQDIEGMDAASSDALKEGVHRIHHEGGNYYYSAFRNHPDPNNWTDPFLAFKELWNSMYANSDANPFVWVYEFRRVKP